MSGMEHIRVIISPQPKIELSLHPPTSVDGVLNVNLSQQPDFRAFLNTPQVTVEGAREAFCSFAEIALSASFATNAAFLGGLPANNYAITGSNVFTDSQIISGSVTLTGSLFIGTTIELNAPESYLDIHSSINTPVLFVSSSGAIGVGLNDPLYELHVSGTIYASEDVLTASDRRLKTNITPILGAMDLLRNIQGVSYTKINDISTVPRQYIGFIAQDLKKFVPEVVSGDDDKGYGVSYGNITALLTEAVKELDYKLKKLEYRVLTE